MRVKYNVMIKTENEKRKEGINKKGEERREGKKKEEKRERRKTFRMVCFASFASGKQLRISKAT